MHMRSCVALRFAGEVKVMVKYSGRCNEYEP